MLEGEKRKRATSQKIKKKKKFIKKRWEN